MHPDGILAVASAENIVNEAEQPEDVVIADVIGIDGAEDVKKAVLVDGKHPLLPEALVRHVSAPPGGEGGKSKPDDEGAEEDDQERIVWPHHAAEGVRRHLASFRAIISKNEEHVLGLDEEPTDMQTESPSTWMEGLPVLTLGHSTRPIDEFLALLEAHGIRMVVDVRTVPRSRRNPQFGIDVLPQSLAGHGIDYVHMPSLGGLRRPRPDSPNAGWRNASFRGFADYMQTPEFEQALEELIATARRQPTAVMCAEAVPWRCHRSLIADALTVRGVVVKHITSPLKAQAHRLTPFVRVEGTRITYPASQ